MAGRRHSRETRSGVEAELLEAARSWRLLRRRWLLWLLVTVSLALSVASLLQVDASEPVTTLEVIMLAVAVAAAVGLISAGTLSLHGSRESRWDAPLTVGIGSLLLGIGTFEQALAAAEAANDVVLSHLEGVSWALSALTWTGVCLVVGGLIWRAETGWSPRTQIVLISAVLVAPVGVSISWMVSADEHNPFARGVLMVLALVLVLSSVRMLRHDNSASVFEGGTVLGTGLALAMVLHATSVVPGDIASIASLAWLVVAGLLTAVWFDRQAALRLVSRRSQAERYVRLIEDTHHQIDEARDDRSRLRHNGSSSLIAIEGALTALEASSASGDVDTHQRMTRVLAAEIARLRRMLVASNSDTQPATSLAEAAESVVQLARLRGQLIVTDVPDDLVVQARQDTVAEIVHNLLENAAVHAPGAVVAVEAMLTDHGRVALVLHDDGPGVRPELRASLFDRGTTSRLDGIGGIGLYSARNLARQAGGELALTDADSGACFRLVLPGGTATAETHLSVVPVVDELAVN